MLVGTYVIALVTNCGIVLLFKVTCLQFYGSRIVSGSDDNTLRVWNAITGKVRDFLHG